MSSQRRLFRDRFPRKARSRSTAPTISYRSDRSRPSRSKKNFFIRPDNYCRLSLPRCVPREPGPHLFVLPRSASIIRKFVGRLQKGNQFLIHRIIARVKIPTLKSRKYLFILSFSILRRGGGRLSPKHINRFSQGQFCFHICRESSHSGLLFLVLPFLQGVCQLKRTAMRMQPLEPRLFSRSSSQ